MMGDVAAMPGSKHRCARLLFNSGHQSPIAAVYLPCLLLLNPAIPARRLAGGGDGLAWAQLAALGAHPKPPRTTNSHTERLRWEPELHEAFLQSVHRCGGPFAAKPKDILLEMSVPKLTLNHVKSHLQKYRLTLKSGRPSAWSLPQHGAPGAAAADGGGAHAGSQWQALINPQVPVVSLPPAAPLQLGGAVYSTLRMPESHPPTAAAGTAPLFALAEVVERLCQGGSAGAVATAGAAEQGAGAAAKGGGECGGVELPRADSRGTEDTTAALGLASVRSTPGASGSHGRQYPDEQQQQQQWPQPRQEAEAPPPQQQPQVQQQQPPLHLAQLDMPQAILQAALSAALKGDPPGSLPAAQQLAATWRQMAVQLQAAAAAVEAAKVAP
jgi:SHAQKYF class myb-like DNA-binding protein